MLVVVLSYSEVVVLDAARRSKEKARQTNEPSAYLRGAAPKAPASTFEQTL